MSKDEIEFAVLLGSVAVVAVASSATLAVYHYRLHRLMLDRGLYWRVGKMEEDRWEPIPGRNTGARP